jgi:hypothetical protein
MSLISAKEEGRVCGLCDQHIVVLRERELDAVGFLQKPVTKRAATRAAQKKTRRNSTPINLAIISYAEQILSF